MAEPGGGVNASIPLGVTGGGSGMMQAGEAEGNPLAMVNSAIELRNKMLEFKAKKLGGEILANSPDLDSAIAELQKNPVTAAFAPQIAANAAATRGAVLDNMGKLQTQGHDAYSNLVKQIPAYLQDSSDTTWNTLTGTSLELASPAIRPQLKKSFERLRQGLEAGLSDDPEQAKQQKLQRIAGFAIANGAGESIPQILGPVSTVNTGGRLQGVQTAPAQGGLGGAAPGTLGLAGNALTVGPNPTIVSTPAGGALAVNPGQGGRLTSGPGGNALAPAGAPPASRPAPKTAAAAPPTSGSDLQAGDGTVLIPKEAKMESPSAALPRDLTGFPLRDSSAQAAVASRLDDWNTKGQHAFENAQNTKGLLAEVTSNYDRLAKGGGFLIPGTGGDLRLNVAKLVNTVAGMTGGKAVDLPFDPTKVSAGEDLNKDTWRLGTTALNFILGAQREAAETIKGAIGAVPGIENTYLGGKFISSMLGAMADRAIDQRNFENIWQADPRNSSDLRGSEIEFNRLHPATDYVGKVLKQFGMTENGFEHKEDVREAYRQGLLTPEQAKDILSSKFSGK